jgi:hypothetical protein
VQSMVLNLAPEWQMRRSFFPRRSRRKRVLARARFDSSCSYLVVSSGVTARRKHLKIPERVLDGQPVLERTWLRIWLLAAARALAEYAVIHKCYECDVPAARYKAVRLLDCPLNLPEARHMLCQAEWRTAGEAYDLLLLRYSAPFPVIDTPCC